MIDAAEVLQRRETSLLLADTLLAEPFPCDARGRWHKAIPEYSAAIEVWGLHLLRSRYMRDN